MKQLRLFIESFWFALGALKGNLLRTMLSLLGITIGIFATIGALTLVDALEGSIRQSMSFLGDKVLYVEKWPWGFGGGEYKWWEFIKRPNPTAREYKLLEKRVTMSDGISIFLIRGNITVKHKSSSSSGLFMQGVSFFHNKVSDIPVEEGRYFSWQESEKGANVGLIGSQIAQDLFGSPQMAIGKEISIRNKKFTIIGVMKKQGENLLGAPSSDRLCLVPFGAMIKMFSTGKTGLAPKIALKGLPSDPTLTELEAEVKGIMRSIRGLKPKEDDDFALNRSEALADFINTLVGVLEAAGWFIGSFSFLVGGFGIANIMFVSVKERTNLIGIQKSLGAKNSFILSQFLFESVLLSFVGGVAGLFLVACLQVFSTESFVISLSGFNILTGFVMSLVVGVLAGIIPAYFAARLDPVIAIRSK